MDPYGTGPRNPRHPAIPGQSGYPGMPPYAAGVPGHERVGTAQRTIVLELLSRAVGEGYLDLDEYEVRAARVTEGKTVSALYTAVADLPPQFRWDPNQSVPKTGRDKARESAHTMAVVSIALGAASIPLSMCLGAGGIAGIIAIVLGRLGMRDDENRSKALIGLILGLLGTISSFGFLLLYMFT
jgi:hypothetical protein